MNLVFASGFLEPQKLLWIEYFNGLPEAYPDALFPKVPVDGHVSDRAPLLAQQIQNRFPDGDIHVIAHSMGGLDTRYLLAKNLLGLAERIKSLSTISTPHRGSPVADLLLGLIPGIDSAPLQHFLNHFPAVGSGALDDLSTKKAITFNQEIKDVPGVRYLSYFGYTSFLNTAVVLQPTLKFIESRGHTEEEKINDGVVSLASAKWPVDLVEQPWPADHLAQIGHNFNPLHHFDHKAAIARVVRRATEPAAAAAP